MDSPLFDQLMELARKTWRDDEFDELHEAMDLGAAWNMAVENLIGDDDTLAHHLVTELLYCVGALSTNLKWSSELSGPISYAGMIKASLMDNREPFITQMQYSILDYDSVMRDRRLRAEEYFASFRRT